MARSAAPSVLMGVAPDAARGSLVYRALRGSARAVLRNLFDLQVQGREHLPAQGPYILAANHHNYLDGVVLGVSVDAAISFLVMPRVWHATPLHPALHRTIGSIRLDLDRGDVGALRRALAALAEGRVVAIFPEGPFSVRGRLEPGLPGVALLALHSGVPVVPAGIRGTYEALRGRRFHLPRRHPLSVRFGRPRAFAPVRGATLRAERLRVTERIMTDIAELLA